MFKERSVDQSLMNQGPKIRCGNKYAGGRKAIAEVKRCFSKVGYRYKRETRRIPIALEQKFQERFDKLLNQDIK